VNSETQTNGEPRNDAERTHRIVVGVDGSSASLSALEWAMRQAEMTGFSLEIVMTWEWPTSFGWAGIPSGSDPVADAEKVLEPILSTLRLTHPQVLVAWKVVEGHSAPVLVKESRGAELLVVGSRGHGAFTGMLIGSTSEHCVANATCPVVVFRKSG
jgi:nucleotide-binding universal stress UspA family protein